MRKSKIASRLAGGGGALALALAFSMSTSQVAAVPYASQIRFSETEIIQALGADLLYTLNEDADEVTVEVFNATTATVVRTFNFTSPDVETTVGRHAIHWDNRDEANNLLPISNDEMVIRVNVKKVDNSTEWTYITGNSSNATAKATPQKTIFNGFSSNDVKIPTDPTADQFGLLLVSHSYTPAAPGGVVLFGADLAPVLGNGGGVENVKGQHTAATPGNFSLWKTSFDPLDPDLFWWGGQTVPSKVGVFNIGATDAADIQAVADNAWTTALFPRGFAVGLNDSNQRIAYIAMGNALYRADMDPSYPHTLSGEVILTAAELDGVARYAQEVKVDGDGNVYHVTRLPDGDGRLWRWDKADVDAAPGVLLDETNAAWIVRAPAGSINFNSLHVDPLTGEVFVGVGSANAIGGVYRAGNTADAAIDTQLTSAEQIISYAASAPFPGMSSSQLGHGISQDWQGNFYVTARPAEEIHSFSPPGNGAEYDITTESPTGYSASILFDQSNLVFVDHTNASPNGVVTFNSLRSALLSFGPGGHNFGFAGTNRIEVQTFGPYDEELPDLTPAFGADDFEIVTPNGPALVLQRGSSWEIDRSISIDGLVIASSSTTTPTGTLVNSAGGTHTIDNSWILALPAAASSYTSLGDIPADLLDGSRAHDHDGLIRAGDGLTVSGAAVSGSNVVISQHVDGVDMTSGSLDLTNVTVTSNMGHGANVTGGELSLANATVDNNLMNGIISSGTSVSVTNGTVNNNSGSGIVASAGSVTLLAGSEVSDNGANGIVVSGGAALTSDSTYANPNQIVGNPVAGIANSSSSDYSIRNTLIHGSNVGLDLQAGAFDMPFFHYGLTDVIISGSTTAGIRTSAAQGLSAARLTLYDNNSGLLDLGTRSGFWSLELQDTVIAGAGDTAINSPGAGNDSLFLDYVGIPTAGPDAVALVTNAPAAALYLDVPILNVDPEFRSTTYSPNRTGPDFFMAPTASAYVGAAHPDGAFGGSPFGNLGGGSRWTLGSSITTVTVGTEGQLYETLADAVDAVSSLGSTGGQVITILIETDTLETRVSRLGLDTSGGGGVLIRPANGADVTVSWETSPPLSANFYSGQLALGANQGVNNEVTNTENIVLDGRPAGSPGGTQLTFQGPGRHINLTGGAKSAIIRNMVLDSTASSGAVIASNSANLGGVNHHPDNTIIENNLIRAASGAGAHVAIVLQFQNATVTSPIEGLVIRNNRVEYNSSGVFFYPTGHGAEVHGNEFYGRMPAAGLDSRGFYFFASPSVAITQATTTNVYNNYFDLVAQTTSTVNGPALINFDFGTPPEIQTFNFYNNFISMQTNTAANYAKFHVFLTGAVAPARLNALHNSIHIRAGQQGISPTLNTGATGVINFAQTAGDASVNARNNLIRIEEPQFASFNVTESKLGDIVEDYNTVYLVPIDVDEDTLTPIYGRISGVNHNTLADWRTASGKGTNSDEAVIAIAPEENPEVGFSGTWTMAADRVTDPNAPILPNFRWTGIPGDSSVWGGVPGLLTDLPGGNADIDGTARHTGKPYRGAHEAATMPGDNIPPDEDPPPGELGDINEDGVINVADVTALAQAIADGQQGSIPLSVGDINNDGQINQADVEALAEMIVNP